VVDELYEFEGRDSKTVPGLASVKSMWFYAGIHRANWEEGQESGDARDNCMEHKGKAAQVGLWDAWSFCHSEAAIGVWPGGPDRGTTL
jgi:hypothetical protein